MLECHVAPPGMQTAPLNVRTSARPDKVGISAPECWYSSDRRQERDTDGVVGSEGREVADNGRRSFLRQAKARTTISQTVPDVKNNYVVIRMGVAI
jgi:hypothetical protein